VKEFFRELASDSGLSTDDDARAYALEIVNGVRRAVDRLDGVIRAASEHWRVERMSRVDRNVLPSSPSASVRRSRARS
jgi:transcription termination factor NusB